MSLSNCLENNSLQNKMNYLDIETSHQLSYSTVDLFSQSPDSFVQNDIARRNIIDFALFIATELINIIDLFYLKARLDQFDPHVGDTACQIRALSIASLALKKTNNQFIHGRLTMFRNIQQTISNYLLNSTLHPQHEKNNHETIIQFVERIGALFMITKDEWFLFQVHFLTEYKDNTEHNETFINYDRIGERLNVSKKWAKKLVRSYQINIAQLSCDEIKELSPSFSIQKTSLCSIPRLDDGGRPVIPCYLSMKVIWVHLLQKQVPILVQITFPSSMARETTYLIFEPEQLKKKYSYAPNYPMESKKPVFVIVGQSTAPSIKEFKKHFVKLGVEAVILANLAAHPQYSGKLLTTYKDNPFQNMSDPPIILQTFSQELKQMRELAIHEGCSKENSSLFLAEHVYCSTMQIQMDKLLNKNITV